MEYRNLGRTGLKVSFVSLGTGGPSRIGQTTHGDEESSHKVIHRALELGINLIDTAASYSDSEEILGRALVNVPRDRYYLATKFTPAPESGGPIITPDELVASCDRSLKRLNVDHIDIFQFHGLIPSNYSEAVERLFPTMERLRAAGKVRFTGVTEYFFKDPDHQMLRQALNDDLWDTIMVKYGILNLSAEWEVLPMALDRNVGVMNMSAVRVKMTRPEVLEETIARWKRQGHISEEALPQRHPLGFLVRGDVKSIVSAGYKFGAQHEALSTVLIGTGNIAHLEQNIDDILGPPLAVEDVARIRAVFGNFAESEGDTG